MTNEQQGVSVPESAVSVPVPVKSSKNWLAYLGFFFGMMGMCGWFLIYCGLPLNLVGLVSGYLGLKSDKKFLAIAGIVLSATGLILTVIFAILAALKVNI